VDSFSLKIFTAERIFYEGPCQSLIVPVEDGQYGILAHHHNTILAVVPGTMEYTPEDGDKQYAAVTMGIVKIEDGEVLLLVDSAERPEEVLQNQLLRDEAREREAVLQAQSSREYKEAEAAMRRAIYRLRNKQEHKEI